MMQASFVGKCSWTDADGNPVTPAATAVSCPYCVAIAGHLPIPDGTPAGVEFDIPFTGIASACSLLRIENITGQELGMAWGGNFMPSLPPGGLLFWAFPVAVMSRPITSLRFFTTAPQSGVGKIVYSAMGT